MYTYPQFVKTARRCRMQTDELPDPQFWIHNTQRSQQR